MKDQVYKVVSQILSVPLNQINDEFSPDQCEKWDSLKHMNLILALEEEFQIQFGEEQIVDMLNVGLIIESIKEVQA
jgi:acyl carrier protein